MQDEHYDEWVRLSQVAARELRGEFGAFQLALLPSFGNEVVWSVYGPHKKDGSHVEIRTWRRDLDLAKFENPLVRLRFPTTLSPTVEIEQKTLSEGWVSQRLDELGKLQVPVVQQKAGITLDGSLAEFRASGVSLAWSFGHPPFGWESLENWFKDTLGDL